MSSDPFEDDPFFAEIDLTELDACEARALTSTQARITDRGSAKHYHHTVVSPRPETSIKAPRPLNTEPRAGGSSTFGFGEGGKHAHPANESRFVDNVRKRTEYWGLHRGDDEGEHTPSVIVDASGRYDLTTGDADDQDELVVDLYAPGARAKAMARRASPERSQGPSSQGALARRAAIAQAASVQPLQSHSNPGSILQSGPVHNAMRPPLSAGAARPLSRSVSAGNHVFTKTSMIPNLPPIASQQSNSQLPASQGSQFRRSVIELDNERQRREELEEQIRRLKEELGKRRQESNHWTNGGTIDEGQDRGLEKFQELQTELWKAKGEAATMRRTQQEEMSKHRADAERLRQRIADMERSFAEKEKENVARIESVKSQAIFATHAAFNSTSKGKGKPPAATRPITPTRSQDESPRSRRDVAQAARAINPDSSRGCAPPRFGGLHNAFAGTIKVKPISPTKVESISSEVGRPSQDSDTWAAPQPGLPASTHNAAGSEIDGESRAEGDIRSELQSLVHHTLNYVTPQLANHQERRPAVQRMLQFRPNALPLEYADCCSELLRACCETEIALTQVDATIVDILGRLYAVIVQSMSSRLEGEERHVLTDAVGLISSTIFLFPASASAETCLSLAASSRLLVQRCLAPDKQAAELARRRGGHAPPQPPGSQPFPDVVHHLTRLCEGMCWLPELRPWTGDHLAYIVHTLADPSQHHATVARAIRLFRAACCNPVTFRAVNASIATFETNPTTSHLPVIERFSRYLATPHSQWDASQALERQACIIRAIGMLACADDDAVVLIAEKSSLVPGVIELLHRQATQMLGVLYGSAISRQGLSIVASGLYLLHHLVFPAPLATHLRSRAALPLSQRLYAAPDAIDAMQIPQGIDLQARLLSAAATKEWTALPHVFVSAFGTLSYCDLIVAPGNVDENQPDWRVIQYLAQDLLESVVEGPEADEIYEVYSNGITPAAGATDEMEVDSRAVEEEYAALRDIIVID